MQLEKDNKMQLIKNKITNKLLLGILKHLDVVWAHSSSIRRKTFFKSRTACYLKNK